VSQEILQCALMAEEIRTIVAVDYKLHLTTTFRAMEGLARLCSEGQLEDALLAVVVETKENLRLSTVLLADGTCDFTLQPATDNFLCIYQQ